MKIAKKEFRPNKKSDENMASIPPKLLSVPSLLAHVLIIPAFYLFFVLIYHPAWVIDLLDMNADKMIFNLLMMMCIVLGILCASRIPVTCVRKRLTIRWLHYILWSLAELAAISAFGALYLTLMNNYLLGEVVTSYFGTLGWTAAMIGSILLYPYLLLDFIFTLLQKPEETVQEDELVRFQDSTGQLKLVLASSAIVYVEASTNYVIIKYTEGERLRDYQLRNSMKAIEPLLAKHGITRCQRSYFINPKHVTALRKDKEGVILAELDTASLQERNLTSSALRIIPVSPRYYDELSKML